MLYQSYNYLNEPNIYTFRYFIISSEPVWLIKVLNQFGSPTMGDDEQPPGPSGKGKGPRTSKNIHLFIYMDKV